LDPVKRSTASAATWIALAGLLIVPARETSAQVNQLSAAEPSHRRLALVNAGLTGGLAVVRGLLTGRVDSPGQAARTFTYSAAGGYGFYRSKRLVGRGHFIGGIALAYGSVSIVENASRGEAPLSFLRVGAGPLDARIRTPFAGEETRRKTPRLSIEINAVTALGLLLLPLFDYEPGLYKGTFFHRSQNILGGKESAPRRAVAFNRTVVLGPEAPWSDLRHELIHTIQSLQVSAITPYYRISALGLDLPQPGRSVHWDMQIDWLYSALGVLSLRWDYEDRWAEIEAYGLQEAPK
jgi:hypothetical protein